MPDSIQRDEAYGVVPFVRASDEVRFLVAHEKGRHGYWKFPKGHADAEEEPDIAALRELYEETGVDIEPSALIRAQTFQESYFYTSEDGGLIRKINTYYLSEMDKTYTDPDAIRVDQQEFDDARLVTLEEAQELLLENTFKMLTEARAYLEKRFNV